MRIRFIAFLLIALSFACIASAATTALEIRTMYWKPELNADVAATSGGLQGTMIDLDQDLGMDNTDNALGYEARLNLGKRHHFFGGMWDAAYSGVNDISKTINFAGTQYTISSNVTTDASIDFKQAGYQFDFLSSDGMALGPVLDMHYYEVEAELTATNGSSRTTATKQEDAIAGLIGLALEADLSDQTRLTFRGEGMVYGEGDELYDVRGEIAWALSRNVRAIGGYRIMQVKFDEADFEVDASLEGPYLGLQIEF